MGVELLIDRLSRLETEVREAALKHGRHPSAVELLPVTKYASASQLRVLFSAGYKRMGESRVQSVRAKAAQLSDIPIEWVQIGHLQRNKVNQLVPHVDEVQSVDSTRIAQALSASLLRTGRTANGFLQVNVSGEASKSGWTPEDLLRSLPELWQLPALQWQGLMTMAPHGSSEKESREVFAALRNLRGRAAAEGFPLPELSMGMSGDYPAAIAEGSTCVRLGSALFTKVEGVS